MCFNQCVNVYLCYAIRLSFVPINLVCLHEAYAAFICFIFFVLCLFTHSTHSLTVALNRLSVLVAIVVDFLHSLDCTLPFTFAIRSIVPSIVFSSSLTRPNVDWTRGILHSNFYVLLSFEGRADFLCAFIYKWNCIESAWADEREWEHPNDCGIACATELKIIFCVTK